MLEMLRTAAGCMIVVHAGRQRIACRLPLALPGGSEPQSSLRPKSALRFLAEKR